MKGQVKAWCATPVMTALVIVLAMSSGCVISPRRTAGGGGGSPTPTPTPGTGGQLYVASGNSVLRFSNAKAANGSSAPAATISGNTTRLQNPQRLLLDTTNDRLFVANAGSVLIFENASAKNGNVAPEHLLTGLSAPIDLALDTNTDQLYIADGFSVIVFGNASTANASVVRSFNMGFTIGSILLDTRNDQLFVTDPADNVIEVLGSASLQNVIGQPTALIAGPDTKLSSPEGLALDGSNRLIVGNSTAPLSITVYPNAASANGDVLTAAVISGGNTRLTAPTQIVLDRNTNNGELYVADSTSGSILVFSGMNTANGNVAPTRVITSSNVSTVNGIALDTTR
jgi:hypothetical protein